MCQVYIVIFTVTETQSEIKSIPKQRKTLYGDYFETMTMPGYKGEQSIGIESLKQLSQEHKSYIIYELKL